MSFTSRVFLLAFGLAQALAQTGQSASATGSGMKSTAGPAPTGSASSSDGPPSYSPAMMAAIHGGNMEIAGTSLIVMVGVVAAVLMYRIAISSIRGIRRVSSMESEKQIYWRQPTRWYAILKKHIIYAPIVSFNNRSRAGLARFLSAAKLPTRFQSIFVTVLVLANIIYCIVGIEWNMVGTTQMIVHLQYRTGSIAVANLLPIVLFAGRNNPLVVLLNIPYENFNLLHKCLGRIVAAEAIAHMSCFFAADVARGGWPAVAKAFTYYGYPPQTGLIVSLQLDIHECC